MTSWLGISLAVVALGQPAKKIDTAGFDAFRALFCPMSAGDALGSPRAQRYIARFDREVAELVESFDFDRGLLDITGPVPPAEIADLSQKVRKTYAESGRYHWLSWLGRGSSEAIGAFALAWALPGSRHFGDQRLRRGAVRGIEAFLEHQAASGEFVFCPIRFGSVYGSHEMAWRLEPLLAAYLCLRPTLPPDQAKRFGDGLRRAADYLYKTPCWSQSNRGCIWCGVTAVAGKVFDRPEYLDRVRDVWAWVGRRVFTKSGQVVEGPGPDFVYSYESFRYTFLRRVAGGDGELDEPLTRALEWLITMHDSAGLPMQTVSTRLNNYGPRRLADLLAALEFYARQRPYLASVVSRYLDVLERESGRVATTHGGILWIAAALCHEPQVLATPLPDRLRRYTSFHEFDVTRYLNVRRNYQTLILFSGVQALSGLQHWCLAGERPILFAYGGGRSTVRAWATDTAQTRLSNGLWRIDKTALETASANWGRVWTCYVFGESSTWVLNVAPGVRRELCWAIHGSRCPTPMLDGRTVRSSGQKARIDIGPGAVSLVKAGDGWQVHVALPDEEPVDWTVFHDGRAGPVDATLTGELLRAKFQDDLATYELRFNIGTRANRADGMTLAPLQASVRRVRPK